MANQQADAKVTVLTGKAYAERNGTRITLTEGADVYASDTIITDSASGVEVVFRDNAVIKLGPGSQVAVQDFVYDGENNPSFAVQLVTGVMTSLSGEVVKQNPAAFKISTPRATIGIRGTETYHSVQGDVETHAVVHISKGHIVMLNSSDGQAITLGAAMQAVTLNESGQPLTIRTFQPNEMDKLQDALGTVNKQVQVQVKQGPEGQDGQAVQQNGEEAAAQSAPTPQPTASSTVVQDEIRVIVVAEAGTDTTVALVQDTMTQAQVSTGLLIESPVISPIAGGDAASTEIPLTDTILADNPLSGSAVEFVPPPNPTPPSVPEAPGISWNPHAVGDLAAGGVYTATEGNDSIIIDTMGNGAIVNAASSDDIISVETSNGGIVNGGAGDDSLYLGGAPANTITISGVEHVYGNGQGTVTFANGGESATISGVRNITGGTGDDTIISIDPAFDHQIAGGAGNDFIHVHTISGATGFLTVTGDAGNDTIVLDGVSGVTNVNVGGGDGNDLITINNVNSRTSMAVTAGVGDDTVIIDNMAGTHILRGGEGNDVITIGTVSGGTVYGDIGEADTFSNSNDTITINGMTAGVVHAGVGNDMVTVGTMGGGSVNGNAGEDTISVGKLTGGTVSGGAGVDNITIGTLAGGTVNGDAGNDVITIGNIAAGGVATVNGGDGSDTFKLGNWDNGSVLKMDANGLDTLQFTEGGVSATVTGPYNGSGYGVNFVQDGKILSVIFNSQADYEALKANISGVTGSL